MSKAGSRTVVVRFCGVGLEFGFGFGFGLGIGIRLGSISFHGRWQMMRRQGYITSISRVYHGFHEYIAGMSRVYLEYITGMSRVCHGYIAGMSWVHHGYITGIFNTGIPHITRVIIPHTIGMQRIILLTPILALTLQRIKLLLLSHYYHIMFLLYYYSHYPIPLPYYGLCTSRGVCVKRKGRDVSKRNGTWPSDYAHHEVLCRNVKVENTISENKSPAYQ